MKVRLLLALSIIGTATGFVLPIFAQDTVDPKIAEQVRAFAMKFMSEKSHPLPHSFLSNPLRGPRGRSGPDDHNDRERRRWCASVVTARFW
jgi:hypothetical protein